MKIRDPQDQTLVVTNGLLVSPCQSPQFKRLLALLLPLSQLTYTNNISGCIPEDLKDLVFLSKVIKVEGRNNLRRSCLINMAHLL